MGSFKMLTKILAHLCCKAKPYKDQYNRLSKLPSSFIIWRQLVSKQRKNRFYQMSLYRLEYLHPPLMDAIRAFMKQMQFYYRLHECNLQSLYMKKFSNIITSEFSESVIWIKADKVYNLSNIFVLAMLWFSFCQLEITSKNQCVNLINFDTTLSDILCLCRYPPNCRLNWCPMARQNNGASIFLVMACLWRMLSKHSFVFI